jgi:hypothetical protein
VVFTGLGRFVTAGEFKDALSMLPKKLLQRLAPALLNVA